MSRRPTLTATTPTPATPAPGQFYDARRGVYYTKPLMRGWLHLLWFGASLVLSTLLLANTQGTARLVSFAVYAVSVGALFGVSALYHCGTWSEASRQRLQRLDHVMIFFLIAGTATPVFIVAAPGTFGRIGLIALWVLTATAAGIHLAWMDAPERLVGGTFLALGWVAALALPEVWIHSGPVAGGLMLGGGLLYTVGALSYHRRRPDPYPSVFGYHEVFHVYVCAGAACQYLAIAVYLR
ncbi:MAG: hemolysin III family protein [Streptosporangiaceae bacterium]